MSGASQLDIGSARRTSIDADGVVVAALECGDGEPVLLVPGYTGSKEDFAPLLDPLAAAGYRAVAVDLPGQFESAGPDEPGAYSVGALGSVVRAVAASLGPRIRLVGHSFGGLVARDAVISGRDAFASLVLMCSGPAALGGARRERIDLLAPVLETAGMAGVYAAIQRSAQAEPGYAAPPPELAEFLERRFVSSSPAMLLGMGNALRTEPDRVTELAACDIPTIVIYGVDDDAWLPSVQVEMAHRLNSRAVAVDGAAHSPAVENPATTIEALLQFWRSASTSASDG